VYGRDRGFDQTAEKTDNRKTETTEPVGGVEAPVTGKPGAARGCGTQGEGAPSRRGKQAESVIPGRRRVSGPGEGPSAKKPKGAGPIVSECQQHTALGGGPTRGGKNSGRGRVYRIALRSDRRVRATGAVRFRTVLSGWGCAWIAESTEKVSGIRQASTIQPETKEEVEKPTARLPRRAPDFRRRRGVFFLGRGVGRARRRGARS